MDSQKKNLPIEDDNEMGQTVNAASADLNSIDKDGEMIQKMHNGITYDFNTLYHLSPVGMLIFDKKGILSVNQVLINLLKINDRGKSTVRLEDVFENSSVKLIKQWMKKYIIGTTTPFCNQVVLKDSAGENIQMNLTIYELKNEGSLLHFLGQLQAAQASNKYLNNQLAHEVCSLLKRENIAVSEKLEKQITQTIRQQTIKDNFHKKSFFTRREDEVLRLSMEGLSIKIIADQLSLSTRTVEKYRTKLMLKSEAKNIAEVIVFALKNNLVKI